MQEEGFVARAEVVQPRFAVRCDEDAVLGASAVTNEADFAVKTLLWKPIALILSEFSLFLGSHHVDEGCLHNITQLIIRLDEVVAGEEIAVVFHR